MKKIAYLLLMIMATSSCGKFLEESSQDLIIPTTILNYSEMLYGEGYQRSEGLHPYLDIMTDDVTCYYGKPGFFSNDTRETAYGYYTFQKAPEVTLSGSFFYDDAWAKYYSYILISNITLDGIEDIDDDPEAKYLLTAEANMIKAYSYFMLVNLYAEPYDPATASSKPGVPINNLTAVEDVSLPRASLSENYEVITDCLEKAFAAFASTSKENNIYRWNEKAAHVFASRVYLYMQDWDESLAHSNAAIIKALNIYNLNDKAASDDQYSLYAHNSNNPEILLSYGSYGNPYLSYGANGTFPTSTDLINSYEDGDLRYGHYIKRQGSFFSGYKTTQYKYSYEEPSLFGLAIRASEAYINRAEALIQSGDFAAGVDDINFLRKYRIEPDSYAELAAADQTEAMELLKLERRREFCYEQQRWFDLRRWGMPEIVHVFVDEYNPYAESTYVLKQGDQAYTLPIPMTVMSAQSNLVNNERPERSKE